MKKYKAIFFDLDHTLWDYETNSAEALAELHGDYELEKSGISKDSFITTFKKINNQLWHLYDQGYIQQDVIRLERFHKIFLEVGLDNYDLSLKFSNDYLTVSPKKGNLLPHTLEILEYLSPHYDMHIITNGFSEIQLTKLSSSGIKNYFKSVVTSQLAGHKKPSKEIFEFALDQNNLTTHEVIMIGDNLVTDIAGAKNASLNTIYFNPEKISHHTAVTHEIASLMELKSLL